MKIIKILAILLTLVGITLLSWLVGNAATTIIIILTLVEYVIVKLTLAI